tara:strand:+ start:1685 stop:1894 length:210 start_codon:yes stop_codon:yes gene_type:complete
MQKEKQTTAVQWLMEQYKLCGMITKAHFDKAKAIERKQIEDTYKHAYTSGFLLSTMKPSEYFEKTFTEE